MPKLGLAALSLAGAAQLRTAQSIIAQAAAQAGSGSGSSGTAVGLDLLTFAFTDSEKIIWDYFNGWAEEYGNYQLKTEFSRPVISADIPRLFTGAESYFPLLTKTLVLDGGGVAAPNNIRITDGSNRNPNLNSKLRLYNASGGGGFATYLWATDTGNGEMPAVSIQAMDSGEKRLIFHFADGYYNYASGRSTTKVGKAASPYYYELINGRVWRVDGSWIWFQLANKMDAELNAAAAESGNTGPFQLWQSNVFDEKMYTENPNVLAVVKTDGTVMFENSSATHTLPSGVAKEDVKKIVPTNTTVTGAAFYWYTLTNSGNLYRSGSVGTSNNGLVDTGVTDITFSSSLHGAQGSGVTGIKNDYLYRYPSQTYKISEIPTGGEAILADKKFKLVSGNYAIRIFS
jgi:hypothetical protein